MSFEIYGRGRVPAPRCQAFFAAAGFRLVMRPLSVPALSSISALISVGLPEATASAIAFFSYAGLFAVTPTPPKACIMTS